jgi:hypothetical protein
MGFKNVFVSEDVREATTMRDMTMRLKFRKTVEVDRSEVIRRNETYLYPRAHRSSTPMTVKQAFFWTDKDNFCDGKRFVLNAERPKTSLVLMFYLSLEAHRREPQIMYRIRVVLFLADEGARLRPYTPSGLFWILREEEEQGSKHNYLYELSLREEESRSEHHQLLLLDLLEIQNKLW